MYRCIGQIKDNHGHVTRCSNTSETPTNPNKPHWGYLCHACANRPPERHSAVKPVFDIPDIDFRNQWEETAGAGDGYTPSA